MAIERDLVTKQLRQKEDEIEKERCLRLELNQRLLELQQRVGRLYVQLMYILSFIYFTFSKFVELILYVVKGLDIF